MDLTAVQVIDLIQSFGIAVLSVTLFLHILWDNDR